MERLRFFPNEDTTSHSFPGRFINAAPQPMNEFSSRTENDNNNQAFWNILKIICVD